MTENEVQKWLEKFEWDDSEETNEALATICEVLQEYPKFRTIGTIEEFKALKEKNVAKKPIERKRNYLTVFDCPTCNAELYSGQRFCDECGQPMLDDYE